MALNPDQLRRYARHIVLPEIGERGQEKLLASSVLVIGAGGLGSAALAYLAAAGIGRIGIVEPDRVELSNLQRQVLFETVDTGRSKLDAARDRIEEINPDCRLETFFLRFDEANGAPLVRSFDIIVDGTDNFATRFAISDACFEEKKTLISAAISGFEAQLSTFKPHAGKSHPCYRCFVGDTPKREMTCAQEGIAGPLAGVMGSMQALEVIKELLDMPSLSGKLLLMDALSMQIRITQLPRDPQCRFCA
jgi:molybdopterin/thiamine biosynthesis adenylyltransferase